MHVRVARVVLRIPETGSLKEKRMVVRSVTRRVRNRFGNVAVAEVETQDHWGVITLGLACVSGDARHANEMLDKVVAFIESARLDAEVEAIEAETIAL